MIRPAKPGDAGPIAALESLLFGADAWSLSSVEEELSGADRCTFVAVSEDDLLGYASTMRSGDVVDLLRIAVHRSRRREGLARSLLAAAVEQARSGGADRMLLEVGSRNRAALAFYAGEGFVEIHLRERYYRDGSDALVLQRPLTGGTCGARLDWRR